MSEAESILVVFGALYLSECILWIPADAVCLTGIGRWLRPAWKPSALGNTSMQVFVLSLWPAARGIVSMPWRVVPGADRVALRTLTRGWQTIEYSECANVSVVGSSLQLANRSIELRSVSQATAVQQYLRQLSLAPTTERGSVISGIIRRSCDPDRAARVMHVSNERLYSLRQLAGILLLWTFIAGPVFYVFGQRTADSLIRFAIVYLSLWWLCAIVGFRRQRQLLPALRKQRWSSLLLSLISPPHAIREADRILVHCGRHVHPLAFAMTAMREPELLEWVRPQLAALRYSVFRPPAAEPDDTHIAAEAIVRNFNQQLASELTARLCDAGFTEEQLQHPDEKHPDAVCWCPRCFNQFTETRPECDDCPGVPVVTF